MPTSPPIICSNNEAALILAKNPKQHQKASILISNIISLGMNMRPAAYGCRELQRVRIELIFSPNRSQNRCTNLRARNLG